MSTQEKILIVSDSPLLHSGLARVVRELADRFMDNGADVRVAGWFHQHVPPEDEVTCLVYPVSKEIPNTVQMPLEDFRPTIVLAIGDPLDFVWLAQQRAAGAPWRLAGYLNIESDPLPPSLESTLDAFDVLVATSEFGAKVINRPYVKYALHGVDPRDFRVTSPPKRFHGKDVAETFIVFVNAQNVQRKNLAAAIQGFARFVAGFASEKDDVFMYMNTKVAPELEDAPGQNLADVVLEEGIAHLVGFCPANRGPMDTVDDRMVNTMYSAATVLLHTSSGEGCGLPILEALATGTPVVVTDGYSAVEIVGRAEERGYFIENPHKYRTSQGWDMLMVDAESVALSLRRAYADWKSGEPFERKRQAGIEWAANVTWDHAYEVIVDALNERRSSRVANGGSIHGYLRVAVRKEAPRECIGVLKMGGIGDMLQTTAVVRAAHKKWDLPVAVISNNGGDIFPAMPEVVYHRMFVDVMTQDEAARTFGDLFDVFIDVRYVSRAWGIPEAPFHRQHKWFYENWAHSNARIHTLNKHTTKVMLESLGLEGDIVPVFTPREEVVLPYPNMVAVCSGGTRGLKRWPGWPDLAGKLLSQGLDLVQIGHSQDPTIPGALDYRGGTLAAAATILERVDLLVTNESAMMHLAAATKTRTLVVCGPTPTVSFVYPGQVVATQAMCQPCFGNPPTWGEDVCAIGEAHCVNFPAVDTVAGMIKRMRG